MIDRRSVMIGLGSIPLAWSDVVQAQRGPVTVPVALGADRVTVAALVNGRGPYLFALDSGGAVNLIGTRMALSLGLAQRGTANLDLGSRPGWFPIYDAELIVGEAFRQARASLVGTDFIGFGDDVEGSLSSGFLTDAPS